MYTDQRGSIVSAYNHRLPRRGNDHESVTGSCQFSLVSGAGVTPEQRESTGAGKIDALAFEPGPHGTRIFAICAQNFAETSRIAVGAKAENGGIDATSDIDGEEFTRLQAFNVDEFYAIAGMDRDGNDAPAGHGVSFLTASEHTQGGPHCG